MDRPKLLKLILTICLAQSELATFKNRKEAYKFIALCLRAANSGVLVNLLSNASSILLDTNNCVIVGQNKGMNFIYACVSSHTLVSWHHLISDLGFISSLYACPCTMHYNCFSDNEASVPVLKLLSNNGPQLNLIHRLRHLLPFNVLSWSTFIILGEEYLYHVRLCINIYQLLGNATLSLGSCWRQVFILSVRCERLACGARWAFIQGWWSNAACISTPRLCLSLALFMFNPNNIFYSPFRLRLYKVGSRSVWTFYCLNLPWNNERIGHNCHKLLVPHFQITFEPFKMASHANKLI